MSFYENKRVFITGGSAGIGRAAAIQLARAGASVIVAARGQAALDETVAAMRAAGRSDRHYSAVALDVTDREALRVAAAAAVSAMGGVDLLICNTGFAHCRPVAEADIEDFRRLMEVNFFGHVNTVQAFLPTFKAQRSGHIVLVASMLAVLSVWGYGAYAASKFAIRGFAESLRQEMKLAGVSVKLFLPPTTDTPGLARENEDKPPIVHEMEMGSSLNKTHSADTVATKMLGWIPSGRFVGYATFDSWFQYFAARHFPELTLKIADGEMEGAIKRLEAKGVKVERA
ncbi:MAG: SDR family NAD(P)-dependent oxidoreductase [Myxococcales bacterium]|nr:SDR family NAD(P)-dependent oxidoreductase [Myxococcales bacterium]MCB9534182.1 SDR family NAD(P)-dependent oxidoreductase [Myxococcales bacterium]